MRWACVTCEKRHVRSKPSASSTPASLGRSHSSAFAAFCAASVASFSLYRSCPLSFLSGICRVAKGVPLLNLLFPWAASSGLFLQSVACTVRHHTYEGKIHDNSIACVSLGLMSSTARFQVAHRFLSGGLLPSGACLSSVRLIVGRLKKRLAIKSSEAIIN